MCRGIFWRARVGYMEVVEVEWDASDSFWMFGVDELMRVRLNATVIGAK